MSLISSPPVVLIGGAARSGTALVASILGDHPDAAVLPEELLTDVVRRLLAIAAVRVSGEDEARAALFGHSGSLMLSTDEADFRTLWSLPSYRARFSALLGCLFSTASGKASPSVWGSKMVVSAFWEDTDLLRSLFGDLRLVFILRNPIDVVGSSSRRGAASLRGDDRWIVETVDDSYARWLSAMHRMARLKERFGDAALVLKYEDLCAAPQAQEARIHRFAGLPARPVDTVQSHALGGESRAALAPAERDRLEQIAGGVDTVWSRLCAEDLLERFRRHAPVQPSGCEVQLGLAPAQALLESGFSYPEVHHRWTEGRLARIRLRHEAPAGRDLKITLGVSEVWPREPDGAARLTMSLNGASPEGMRVRRREMLELRLASERLQPDGLLELEIAPEDPKRSDEAPCDDPRALGVAFSTLRLDWAGA